MEIFEGRRLVERNVRALAEFTDPVVVIANDLTPLLDLDAFLVRDILPHRGPLGGIHTALYFSPHPWVLVKATDMPYTVPSLVRHLLRTAREEKADVIVPKTGPHYEPLFAVYHVRCLPHIARCLEREKRQVISFYGSVRVRAVEEPEWRPFDPQGRSFWNINTPEDLERILSLNRGAAGTDGQASMNDERP